ncbi:MAG: Ig-like domain-containing protein [Pirellulaceae bacterium]
MQKGDAATPGLINEAGGTQASLGNQRPHGGPVELYTVTLRAIGAGMTTFQTDPSDAADSDIVFLNDPSQEVPLNRQRFGGADLNIVPAGNPIPTAVDDSVRIAQGTIEANIFVLNNDVEGATGRSSVSLVGTPEHGFARSPDGEVIIYTLDPTFVGVDQFTYTTLSQDGFVSTATVTVFVGSEQALNQGDLVDLPFELFNAAGSRFLTPLETRFAPSASTTRSSCR